jgi:hypothetical protein
MLHPQVVDVGKGPQICTIAENGNMRMLLLNLVKFLTIFNRMIMAVTVTNQMVYYGPNIISFTKIIKHKKKHMHHSLTVSKNTINKT